MKRVFVCFLVALFTVPAFSEEISTPDYAYFYVIRNSRDEETALNAIKTWVAKYGNYNCSIAAWDDTGDEGLGALAIRIIPGPIPRTEVAICQLYLKKHVINIFLSTDELVGITEKYSRTQVDSVYNRIYSLYLNNMR